MIYIDITPLDETIVKRLCLTGPGPFRVMFGPDWSIIVDGRGTPIPETYSCE